MIRRVAMMLAAGMAAFAPIMAPALDIQLTSGDWRPTNIFIERFEGEIDSGSSRSMSGIIYKDLTRSGYFRGYYREVNSYGRVDSDRYAQARNRGGEYLLVGRVTPERDARRLLFELHDALTEKSLGSFSIDFTQENKRAAAHRVSNWVFEVVAKLPGIFHTKVAYVSRSEEGLNQLRVADYDGYNVHTVLSSANPLISPAWSPDGNELLYVSFERRKPVVYKQSLLTGERQVIANFLGSNSAPAMSPDGQRIAVALTNNKTQQQIFILGAAGRQQLRESKGIDTEPAWSPDSKKIVFESDEGGSPQIYEYNIESGDVRRLSFGSRYCVSPSYSSGGNLVLQICRDDEGKNNVMILDTEARQSAQLTDIREADSPSFAPNDTMVLFKNESKDNVLQIVSVNGRIISNWEIQESGKIINPVWGPAKSDWF